MCCIFFCLVPVKKEDLSTSARRKTVDTSVTWLKKTVYLTNDPFDPVHQFKSEQQTQVRPDSALSVGLAYNSSALNEQTVCRGATRWWCQQ